MFYSTLFVVLFVCVYAYLISQAPGLPDALQGRTEVVPYQADDASPLYFCDPALPGYVHIGVRRQGRWLPVYLMLSWWIPSRLLPWCMHHYFGISIPSIWETVRDSGAILFAIIIVAVCLARMQYAKNAEWHKRAAIYVRGERLFVTDIVGAWALLLIGFAAFN